MTSLRQLRSNWELLAQADPLWSICTDPRKRNHTWDEAEFFGTGTREVAAVLGCLASLGLHPDIAAPVLDFGCGVGRLTRALAASFGQCWGVDISETMIRLAKKFNADRPQCRFLVNPVDNLQVFESGYFGFIYTSIVLQHMEQRYARRYLVEMTRILRPGGILVFQLLDRRQGVLLGGLRSRLRIRQRLRKLLGRKGGIEQLMELHYMPESTVRRLLMRANAPVVDVRLTNSAEPSFNGQLQYLQHEPSQGIISKQYCAVKGETLGAAGLRKPSES